MKRTESSGLLVAICGFALLSVGDAVIKTMAGMWPAPAIAALRYAIGAAGLWTLLALREGRASFVPPRPAVQLLRGFAVAIATAGFFASLFLMPISDATAITFTSPMLTAILAAIFLNEPAKRSTWIATAVAFAGVLIILRPNFADIGWPAVLPILAAIGLSLLMIGNRASAGLASPLAMQAYIAAAALPVLVILALAGHLSGIEPLHIEMPHWSVVARCAIVAITASIGHWLIFLGTTRAGAATVAPGTYIQLLVATGIGWVAFGEVPDLGALVGAATIICAGLYLWQSGRSRERGAAAS